MAWATLVVAGVAVLSWLLHLRKWRYRAAISRVEHARAIASFGGARHASWLKQRASPNQRLVRAFRIDNSFTTTDISWHKTFLSQAQHKIQEVHGDGWRQLFEVAEQALHRARAYTRFEDQGGKPQVPLARSVRIVTFITIINVLFHVDPADMSVNDVETATKMINNLWVQSKDCSGGAISVRDQHCLQTVLANLLLNKAGSSAPRENPLNMIIPAYETMWRVVLLTFVSAAFRVSDQETVDQFSSVVESVPGCLGHSEDSRDLRRTLAFSEEGLRLYPPTKRIYREPLAGNPQDHMLKADIEQCHREPAIWGGDALRFDPRRFMQGLTEDQKEAYMPFSIKPHSCPAERGFGVRAIILLVAVLARRFGTRAKGARIVFNDNELDNDMDAVLPNSRDSAEAWLISDR